jgi:hypothetical protein
MTRDTPSSQHNKHIGLQREGRKAGTQGKKPPGRKPGLKGSKAKQKPPGRKAELQGRPAE